MYGVCFMKRFLAFIIIFTLLLSAVGCNNEDKSSPQTTSSTIEETESSSSTTTTTTTQKASETQTTTQKYKETTTKKQNANATVTVFKKDFGDNVVFYPSNLSDTDIFYPIISWANGTGFSYDIYESLICEIVKGGYIVIANTEKMSADGQAQLSSVDFLIDLSKDTSSVFYNKINADKIGLAGHSQGGRSSVNGAVADSRIDCVVSFAGSNFESEAEKLKTPTFFIGGSDDMIVNAKRWLVTAYNACKGPAVYACKKGAIHTRCCTNPIEYSEYALSWFDAWLKNDTNALKKFKNGGKLSQDGAWQDFDCKGI